MSDKIAFEITTPEGVAYKEMIDQVTVPTALGEITILPHHIPLAAALASGAMVIKKDKEEIILACSGGFLEVLPQSRVVILADNAERAEKIDLERAEAARARAAELLRQKHVEDVDYVSLQAKLERELARIRVAKKHRSKHSPRISN